MYLYSGQNRISQPHQWWIIAPAFSNTDVEHVFAEQKHRMGLFVRTIGIARARSKIGMANLVCNLTRYVWHQRRIATA